MKTDGLEVLTSRNTEPMSDLVRSGGEREQTLLLVSLCNVGEEAGPSLLLVDARSSEVTPLAIASNTGATGLCRIGDEILVARQGADASVAVLDARTLEVRSEAPLRGAGDAHSLVAWEDGVAVASSGTDEVLWYRYDGRGFAGRTALWTADGGRKDTMHVNGLAARGEKLVCCGFGPRASETDLWSEAQSGFVYDVVNRHFLLDGLAQPHSVAFIGDELVLCESSHQRFRSIDRPIAEFHGYTRGVALLDRARAVVGTSCGRARSRSSDRLLNPGDDGIDAGDCALHVVDAGGAVAEMVSLAEYGREIYDVLRLS